MSARVYADTEKAEVAERGLKILAVGVAARRGSIAEREEVGSTTRHTAGNGIEFLMASVYSHGRDGPTSSISHVSNTLVLARCPTLLRALRVHLA